MFLRIGASEYDPSSVVKQLTLDARLTEVLNDAKAYELREQIQCADDLIMDLAADVKL